MSERERRKKEREREENTQEGNRGRKKYLELETAEMCLSGVLDGILSMQEAEQFIVNWRVRGNKCGTSVNSDVWTCVCVCVCVCVCARSGCM